MSLTARPAQFAFVIPQGAHFHLEFPPFADATTGELFDFTDDPEGTWTGRMDVITAAGVVLTSFATTGEDGVITLGSAGELSLDLAAEFTDALSPTTEYAGASHGPVYGDVVLTDPADSEPWLWFHGTGEITRKVTEL